MLDNGGGFVLLPFILPELIAMKKIILRIVNLSDFQVEKLSKVADSLESLAFSVLVLASALAVVLLAVRVFDLLG